MTVATSGGLWIAVLLSSFFLVECIVLCFREEEAIKLDGLSVAQMKELQEKAEKHAFQAEVDRMMKLIINSLYKNKEVIIMQLML